MVVLLLTMESANICILINSGIYCPKNRKIMIVLNAIVFIVMCAVIVAMIIDGYHFIKEVLTEE